MCANINYKTLFIQYRFKSFIDSVSVDVKYTQCVHYLHKVKTIMCKKKDSTETLSSK